MTAVLPSGPMDTSLNTRPGLLTTAIVILWIQGATAVVCGLFGLASGFGGGVYASDDVRHGFNPGPPRRLVMVGVLTKRSRDWLAGEPRPVADERAAPAPPATGLETEPRSQE